MLTTIAGIAIEVSWFVVKTAGGLLYSAVLWTSGPEQLTQEQKEIHRLANLAVTNAESLRRIEQEMSLLRQALADSKQETDASQAVGLSQTAENDPQRPAEKQTAIEQTAR